MAIIRLGDAKDIGKPGFSYHLLNQDFTDDIGADGAYLGYGKGPIKLGPNVYATYLSHEGLCVRDFERNGYHDSDFYMVVWNPEKHELETIEFASTRGWSYPCYGSWVDATPEVLRDVANYTDAMERLNHMSKFKADVERLCRLRSIAKEVAERNGFHHTRLTGLRKVMNLTDLGAIINLIDNPRIRSPFKIKLRTQVLAWLKDTKPKYNTPLSKKQMTYI